MINLLTVKNSHSDYRYEDPARTGPMPAGTARQRRSPELQRQAWIAYLAAREVLG